MDWRGAFQRHQRPKRGNLSGGAIFTFLCLLPLLSNLASCLHSFLAPASFIPSLIFLSLENHHVSECSSICNLLSVSPQINIISDSHPLATPGLAIIL